MEKSFCITRKKGELNWLRICDYNTNAGLRGQFGEKWAIVDTFTTQNELRSCLAFLCRLSLSQSGKTKVLSARALLYEAKICYHHNPDVPFGEYSFWIETTNFETRCTWLAGMVHVWKMLHPKKKKKQKV